MALLMPDTQTPDILSLTPCTKSKILEGSKAWGRLYSTYLHLEAVDLENTTFKLGRSEECDVVITESKFANNHVTNISKSHFEILKDDNLIFITDLSKNGTFLNGELIGKGNKNILQNDDEIAIGLKGLKVYIFKVLTSDDNKYLPPELRRKYQVSRNLGRGACGEVKLVFDKVTCIPYAVKKIMKGKNSLSAAHHLNHPNKIKAETYILQTLKHPCIIYMKEIVETEDSVFMILEYMEGGELNNFIVSADRPNEEQVKFIFYQMVLAVQYLHKEGITHRDLKPENVLLQTSKKETLIKVTDFGLSKILGKNEVMKTICGTPNYVAPEIIDKQVSCYDKQVDVWSLGVILFYMLSQEMPFREANRSVLNNKILNGLFNFNNTSWDGISSAVKDLVRQMLTIDPAQRIKIDDILTHPWIDEDVLVQQRVEDLLYSNQATEVIASEDTDSSFGPPAKRSRISDSF